MKEVHMIKNFAGTFTVSLVAVLTSAVTVHITIPADNTTAMTFETNFFNVYVLLNMLPVLHEQKSP